MSKQWELKKLKPIEQVIEENQKGEWYQPYTDEDDGMEIYDWEYTDHNMIWWHINDEMLKRFGDGRYHEFRRIPEKKILIDSHDKSYAHESDDTYIYHESWFEIDIILELDDKDFLL